MISWKVSRYESQLITKIAQRTVADAKAAGVDYDFRTAEMDLTAAHANGCALRLDELLAATEGDFGHDVFGIRKFINRSTGKLDPSFAPRFAL